MKRFAFTKNKVDCVVLMSGSGSNAAALLEYERTVPECAYHITALVTDAPEDSNTRTIAEKYGLPWAHCGIRAFYAAHGEDSIKLDTEHRRVLRDRWSRALYHEIRRFPCEFLLFAGFLTLTNLAEKILCLNVHPGDLTVCNAAGERIYAGLHVLPVERAILNDETSLRSSVILVQPYSGDGKKEMDAGLIPGISAPVPIDLGGYSLDQLRLIKENRKSPVPADDPLRKLALEHIEQLKIQGDHVVFPRAASDFAAGFFACEDDQLFYKGEKVLTVEYTKDDPAGRPITSEKEIKS